MNYAATIGFCVFTSLISCVGGNANAAEDHAPAHMMDTEDFNLKSAKENKMWVQNAMRKRTARG